MNHSNSSKRFNEMMRRKENMKREANEMHQSIGIGVAIVFTIVYLEIDTAGFNLKITNSDKIDQP